MIPGCLLIGQLHVVDVVVVLRCRKMQVTLHAKIRAISCEDDYFKLVTT